MSDKEKAIPKLTKLEGQAIKTWVGANQHLGKLTEQSVAKLLEFEVTRNKRPAMIARLHGRLAKLRMHRERGDLFKRAGIVE